MRKNYKDYLINLYFSEHSKKSVEKKVPAAKAQAQKEKVSLVENVRYLVR